VNFFGKKNKGVHEDLTEFFKSKTSIDDLLSINGFYYMTRSLGGKHRQVKECLSVNNQMFLTSLNGCPAVNHVIGSTLKTSIEIDNCCTLVNLEGIFNDADLYVIKRNSSLTSLRGLHTKFIDLLEVTDNSNLSYHDYQIKKINKLFWFQNKNTDLHDFHYHFPCVKELWIDKTIKSRVLSLLLVEGLTTVKQDYVANPNNRKNNETFDAIINKHLPNTTGKKGMLRCQAELIDAGYAAYAQL